MRKGLELCVRPGDKGPSPTSAPLPPQCAAPLATTTPPPPTGASAAPPAPTSPSLARTTASPVRATPAPTSMAPPTSRTAKVGAVLPRAAGLGAGCGGYGKPRDSSLHHIPVGRPPEAPWRARCAWLGLLGDDVVALVLCHLLSCSKVACASTAGQALLRALGLWVEERVPGQGGL